MSVKINRTDETEDNIIRRYMAECTNRSGSNMAERVFAKSRGYNRNRTFENLIDWDKVVVEDALEKCLPAYKEWGYLYLSSRNSNYSHAESMKRMLNSYLGNIKYVESLTWRMEAGKIYPVIRMAHRSPEEELWRRLGNEFECIKGLLEQHRSKLERTYQSIHCKQ